MKVTLVLVGGLLILAPLVADYMLKTTHQANVVKLLEKPDAKSVNLFREEIHSGLSIGCWFTGTMLAVTGIYLAIRETRAKPDAVNTPPAP
jgi:hypothetical protein